MLTPILSNCVKNHRNFSTKNSINEFEPYASLTKSILFFIYVFCLIFQNLDASEFSQGRR